MEGTAGWCKKGLRQSSSVGLIFAVGLQGLWRYALGSNGRAILADHLCLPYGELRKSTRLKKLGTVSPKLLLFSPSPLQLWQTSLENPFRSLWGPVLPSPNGPTAQMDGRVNYVLPCRGPIQGPLPPSKSSFIVTVD